MKNKLCKWLGHKWQYARIHEYVGSSNGQHIRVCKRCNRIQAREWYPYAPFSVFQLEEGEKDGRMIWSNAIQYTDKGAKNHVPGYGEE